MSRDAPLVAGETYHVFNRGAHKRDVFIEEKDYHRFLLLLFLANNTAPINIRDLLGKYESRSMLDVFTHEETDKSLVDVLAYSLMPNHIHLVLRQKVENGITLYMKRIGVGYAMYFNLKHSHSGVLFQGRFKSRHVDNEAYFRYLFAYVHLNPLDIVEYGWKDKKSAPSMQSKKFVEDYPFSSFRDYTHQSELRPQRNLLSLHASPDFLLRQNDLDSLFWWYKAGREYGGLSTVPEMRPL